MEINARTEVVEVNVGTSITTAYNFGQLPQLREATKIVSIEAYDVTQVALSRLNKTVISNTVLKKSYLELVERGGAGAVIATVPLMDISKQTAASIIDQQDFPTIDWEKSVIRVAETTGLNANESFIFKVKYIKAARK
ncbi:MAG: hypothetical protein ABIQ31_18615 [Ferruginibacter sp.]